MGGSAEDIQRRMEFFRSLRERMGGGDNPGGGFGGFPGGGPPGGGLWRLPRPRRG